MRGVGTISRYLASEILAYTALAFAASMPVILIPNVLLHLDEFMIAGVAAADLVPLFGWVLVLVTCYALPIAFLFGLLLAMGRLHGDRELTAMRACGLGVCGLVAPALMVGTLLSLLTAAVSIGLEHVAWRQIEAIRIGILSRGAVIEPGRFERFGERMILARDRRGTKHLLGVVVSDRTVKERPLLLFAESAEYSFEPRTGTLRLALANGDIRVQPHPGDAYEEYRISFSESDYSFRAPRLRGDRWRFRPNQLSFGELREAVARGKSGRGLRDLWYRQPRYYESRLHELLAVPLVPLLFSLIGVPMAIRGFVRSRSLGLLLALLLLGAYYAAFLSAYVGARNGAFPPLPAIWAPDAVLVLVAFLLLHRSMKSG